MRGSSSTVSEESVSVSDRMLASACSVVGVR